MIKTLGCVLIAALAQDPTGRAALEQAIVIEEREHDLGEAMARYRAIGELGTNPAELRVDAWLRLGRVALELELSGDAETAFAAAVALGADEERVATFRNGAKQDARQLAMRENARELIRPLRRRIALSMMHRNTQFNLSETRNRDTVQKLLWLGDAAAHELANALREHYSEDKTGTDEIAFVYAHLLWSIDGPVVAEFAAEVRESRDVHLRRAFATGAASATHPTMHRIAESFYADSDWIVKVRVLRDSLFRLPSWDLGIPRYVKPEHRRAGPLVDVVAGDDPAAQLAALELLTEGWAAVSHEDGPEATAAKLAPIVSGLLDDPDPGVSRAANAWFVEAPGRSTRAGTAQLLRSFDRITAIRPSREVSGIPVAAADLVPLARAHSTDGKRELLSSLIQDSHESWTSDDFDAMADLIEAGFGDHGFFVGRWVSFAKDGARLLRVAQLLPKLDSSHDAQQALTRKETPPEAWPHIRDAVMRSIEDGESPVDVYALFALVGARVPDAAPLLFQLLEAGHAKYEDVASSMVWLDKECDDTVVREHLRRLLVRPAKGDDASKARDRVFQRLVEAGDVSSIPSYPVAYGLGLQSNQSQRRGARGSRRGRSRGRRGIHWLLPWQRGPEVHGFDAANHAKAMTTLLDGAASMCLEDLRDPNTAIPVRSTLNRSLADGPSRRSSTRAKMSASWPPTSSIASSAAASTKVSPSCTSSDCGHTNTNASPTRLWRPLPNRP